VSALSEAVDAAQAKALAALEKAYVRGHIDAEALVEKMNAIGCRDGLDHAALIEALDVLHFYGQTEPTYTEKRQTEKPTAAQVSYIGRLCAERELTAPDLAGVTRAQASEIIDSLQRGTYDEAKWTVPF
jgi:hypothetical protein